MKRELRGQQHQRKQALHPCQGLHAHVFHIQPRFLIKPIPIGTGSRGHPHVDHGGRDTCAPRKCGGGRAAASEACLALRRRRRTFTHN
jgi:hypothetical protein